MQVCFALLLVVQGTIFTFLQRDEASSLLPDSQHCCTLWGGRRRKREEEVGGSSPRSPTWTALLKASDVTDTSLLFVFATPISSVTGARGGTRQSSPPPSLFLFPTSSSHPVPRPFISITLRLSSFFWIVFTISPTHTLSGFSLSPPNTSSLSLLTLVSLQHAYSQGGGEREREREEKEGTCHSDCEASSCFPQKNLFQAQHPCDYYR